MAKDKDQKLVDTFISVVKFTDQKVWTILSTNKKLETIKAILKTHENQIEAAKLYKMDGVTTEITLVE